MLICHGTQPDLAGILPTLRRFLWSQVQHGVQTVPVRSCCFSVWLTAAFVPGQLFTEVSKLGLFSVQHPHHWPVQQQQNSSAGASSGADDNYGMGSTSFPSKLMFNPHLLPTIGRYSAPLVSTAEAAAAPAEGICEQLS